MIRKIEVERFTLISSKPFDQVVAALNSAVGYPDIVEFWKSTDRAQSVAARPSTRSGPKMACSTTPKQAATEAATRPTYDAMGSLWRRFRRLSRTINRAGNGTRLVFSFRDSVRE